MLADIQILAVRATDLWDIVWVPAGENWEIPLSNLTLYKVNPKHFNLHASFKPSSGRIHPTPQANTCITSTCTKYTVQCSTVSKNWFVKGGMSPPHPLKAQFFCGFKPACLPTYLSYIIGTYRTSLFHVSNESFSCLASMTLLKVANNLRISDFQFYLSVKEQRR